MTEILECGSDSQRTVILFELQDMLEHCFDETLRVMVPAVCKLVPNWSRDLQLSVAESLLIVVQKSISGENARMISSTAFDVITGTRAGEIFEAWGEILVVVLPKVRWSGNNEISSVIAILDEFTVSDEDICRKLVARVLGSFSSCLSKAEVETYVLNRALQLVDDNNLDVRGMVSESLAFVCEVVEIDVVETRVWPKLLSLLEDPNARIHAATLQTIAHVAEVHKQHKGTSSLFRRLLPPVFARECEFARVAAEKDQRKVDDDTYLLLETISEVFGPFVFAVHQYLTEDAGKTAAFRAFLAMATCNGPVVRRYCAFNFPGIARSLGGCYNSDLSGIAEFLSRDSDPETRWNLAAGMHETTRHLLCKSSSDSLFKTAESLLQDDNPLVRTNALGNFHELIPCLSNGVELGPRSQKKLSSIFQNLALFTGDLWRTQELLAKQLERVSSIVPPECLTDHVLPLLYRMAEESTYLVRKAAMSAIATAIWCLPQPVDREKTMKAFCEQWGEGSVYWMRIAFVDCADAALNLFSSALFERLFVHTLLKLARDKVGNVRLRLSEMIHNVAPVCFDDQRYKEALTLLRNDMTRDVQEVMDGVNAKIEIRMKAMDTFRKMDQDRELVEAERKNKFEKGKGDIRRKGGMGRVSASTFLTKIGGKGTSPLKEQRKSDLASTQQNEDTFHAGIPLSPMCVRDTKWNDDQYEETKKKTDAGSVQGLQELVSGSDVSEGRTLLSSSSPKSENNLSQSAPEEQSTPQSPSRKSRRFLSLASDDSPPGSGNRKTLKSLLSHVGSGFRSMQQQPQK